MKTIEERAKIASEGYDDDSYSAGLYMGYVVGASEQKDIDEDIRLKKCDAMTKEEFERETTFLDQYIDGKDGMPSFSDAIEWARKEAIKEAAIWFGDYLTELRDSVNWFYGSSKMKSGKDRFMEAMNK